jgi:lysyl-tRNA synthetase class 2
MPDMNHRILRLRGSIIETIRRFFRSNSYHEVDTPALSPSLIPEAHIGAFQTEFFHPARGSRRLFLVPSPEIWMKQLLAHGSGSIFQLCKSFRNHESIGAQHNPEFTMLEWYTVGHDYSQSMDRTESLLYALSAFEKRGLFRWPFHRISMAEAFSRWADVPLRRCEETAELRRHGKRIGVNIPEDASWEEAFNRIFLSRVEPALPADRPVFVYDYPARIPVLAQPAGDPFYAERWELYVSGVEIANCFTEETHRQRLRQFFREQNAATHRGTMSPTLTQDLPAVFSRIPEPTSGVALGLDRLIAVLAGVENLQGVILFPFSSIIE